MRTLHGLKVSVARVQQKMVTEYYPDRKDMLNALEFVWWLPPAHSLPAKYYEELRI